MNSVLYNKLLSKLKNTQLEDLTNNVEKNNKPLENISEEQKNIVYILNNFLNSCVEMNLDEIINYVRELNKKSTSYY